MFSIVIPLYNKRDFISSTLKSVLAQDFLDYEVIVVDDGSTDGSVGVVEAFDDSRIRVLRQSNQGVGPARNAGIRASTRPWIAFLDADDLWASNHLSTLKAVIETSPEAGFISTRWEILEQGQKSVSAYGANRDEFEVKTVEYFEWCVDEPRYFHTSSIAVKRDLFDIAGTFGAFQPGEDVELWVRLALTTKSAIAVVTTDGRRQDLAGIMARATSHIPTEALAPDNLPTAVLRLLAQYLRTGQTLNNRASVMRYFDHRLLIGIRVALLEGDRVRAWKMWSLMHRPFRMQPLLHLAASVVPIRAVQLLAKHVRRASRLHR